MAAAKKLRWVHSTAAAIHQLLSPELVAGDIVLTNATQVHGVGGSIGPDLTEEGAIHRQPEWLNRHFLDPNSLTPSSPMPNFHFTDEQARDSRRWTIRSLVEAARTAN